MAVNRYITIYADVWNAGFRAHCFRSSGGIRRTIAGPYQDPINRWTQDYFEVRAADFGRPGGFLGVAMAQDSPVGGVYIYTETEGYELKRGQTVWFDGRRDTFWVDRDYITTGHTYLIDPEGGSADQASVLVPGPHPITAAPHSDFDITRRIGVGDFGVEVDDSHEYYIGPDGVIQSQVLFDAREFTLNPAPGMAYIQPARYAALVYNTSDGVIQYSARAGVLDYWSGWPAVPVIPENFEIENGQIDPGQTVWLVIQPSEFWGLALATDENTPPSAYPAIVYVGVFRLVRGIPSPQQQ